MRFMLLLAGIFLLSFQHYAQDTTFYQSDRKLQLQSINIEALNLLLRFKQHASIGVEFSLSNKLSVDIMAGWYLQSTMFGGRQGDRYTGPRLRAGVHWLLTKNNYEELHLGIQLKSDFISHHQNYDLIRQGRQYREIFTHKRDIVSTGMAGVLTGKLSFIESLNLNLNFFGGFGFQILSMTSNFPDDAEFVTFPIIFRYRPGRFFEPYLTAGIQLSYILNR